MSENIKQEIANLNPVNGVFQKSGNNKSENNLWKRMVVAVALWTVGYGLADMFIYFFESKFILRFSIGMTAFLLVHFNEYLLEKLEI